MTELEDLREDVLSVYVTLTTLLAPRLGETRRRLLAASRDRLAEGRYYVVACGEFKRGKSSLLNALVERPGLFPVDADLATCAVLSLEWGEADSAMVHFADAEEDGLGSGPEPTPIPMERVREFVTEQGNPDNAKNVARVEMSAPIQELKSGLVLVDTPGTGGVNPAHSAATRAFLPHADAILFVASAAEPLGVAELDFLKLALAQCPIVVTALTMIDNVESTAQVVGETRTRMATVVGVDSPDLVIVPVSSFRKRDALDEHDPGLLTGSGFPELEAEIWGGLAVTCGAAQLHAALDSMAEALAEAAAPIANDLAAIRGDWAKMDAELRAEEDRCQRLKSGFQGWRRDLQDEVDTATRPIMRRLESDLDGIRDEFSQELGSDEVPSDAGAALQRLSDEMVDSANRASQALDAVMGKVAATYAERTSLSIVVSGVSAGSLEPALNVVVPQLKRRPQGYARFREMWLGASSGSAVGALLGSIVPGVGTVIGGAVGLLAGLSAGRRHQRRNAAEQQRREYLAELRNNVLPKLESVRRRLTRDLARQVHDYGRALVRALEDEVTARGESLAESIQRLSETRKRDAEGRAETERVLVRQQQELTGLRAELDALRTRTEDLSRPGAGPSRGDDDG